MNSICDNVEKFLAQMRCAQEKLGTAHREVHLREEAVGVAFEKLLQELPNVPTENQCSQAIREVLTKTVCALREAIVTWQGAVRMQVQQREFISKFDKSLIVMVYGKVKSGKSSLGNFIAGLDFKSAAVSPYTDFPILIRVHETAQKSHVAERMEEIYEGFEVKATEATNCIQEFTLGGMAWVDTPGIDALTKENVELAHQFVENAELAIYLTSSDSPMRTGDLDALRRLLRKSIPTLLVISKFDEVVEDEDLSTGDIVRTIVVKSDSSREEQQRWAEDRINDAGLNETFHQRAYLFVSTRVAQDAIARADDNAFEGSGIPALYKKLGAIVQEDSIELKSKKPKTKFNALLRDILERGDSEFSSLRSWRGEMKELIQDWQKRREELCSRSQYISLRVQNKLTIPLREILNSAQREFEEGTYDQDAVDARLRELVAKTVFTAVSEDLQRVLQESISDLVKRVSTATPSSASLGCFKKLTETIKVPDNALKEGLGFGIGGTVGGLIGGFLGSFFPPFGTFVGAYVGSEIGSRAGKQGGRALAGTKEMAVDVGVNIEQIRSQLIQHLSESVPKQVTSILEEVSCAWIDPLIETARASLLSLDNLEKALCSLEYRDVK